MHGQRKVYVIDPDKNKKRKDKSLGLREIDGLPGQTGEWAAGGGRSEETAQAPSRQSGVSLIFSYLTGPLAVFAVGKGRVNRLWTWLALFSMVLSLIVLTLWMKSGSWSVYDNPTGIVLISAAALAILSGAVTWTKAVLTAGRYEGHRLVRTPDFLRGPVASGLYGIVCPGMGLFAAGRSRQAAAAIWMAALTFISVLVLSRAGWLWKFNSHAGAFGLDPDILEHILIVAGAVAVIGLFAWIAQFLNGIRISSPGAGRSSSRTNWPALALLASVIALSAFSKPDMIAGALDRGAEAASREGMRIIPLNLSLAAVRLDPSRPDYVVRAIGLYEECGDQASAERMRSSLRERMEVSLPLLEEEGLVTPKSADDSSAAVIPAGLMTLDWSLDRQDR